MDRFVEAQVIDSRHLKLKRPINIAPGSIVIITIEPANGASEDREWYMLASLGLEEAYGEDEPDYSPDTIKEPNPEYQP